MNEPTAMGNALRALLISDPVLVPLTADRWHRQTVPPGVPWTSGTTLLVRGIYRLRAGRALRAIGGRRRGMHLIYLVYGVVQGGSVTPLVAVADRLGVLLDGVTLALAGGRAYNCRVEQPWERDLLDEAAVRYQELGYEIALTVIAAA